MKERVLRWLRCPTCQGALTLEASVRAEDEVMEGALRCSCGQRYAISRGVPRFVVSDRGVENFSYEWLRHRTTQLDSGGRKESEETFFVRSGLREEDLAGKLVLDVGVGTGRFADVAERHGAEVIGVDLSYAVESAFSNVGQRPGVHIVQADLFHLPFPAATFDTAYSLGVLHHTPDCQAAFQATAAMVKEGGRLGVWLYHGYREHPNAVRFYRELAQRLPLRLLYLLCYGAVPGYYLHKIPVLRGLLAQLLPIISLHPDWRWRVLDTFDWYSPRYQSTHTYDEVFDWFKRLSFEDIRPLREAVSLVGRRGPRLDAHPPARPQSHESQPMA